MEGCSVDSCETLPLAHGKRSLNIDFEGCSKKGKVEVNLEQIPEEEAQSSRGDDTKNPFPPDRDEDLEQEKELWDETIRTQERLRKEMFGSDVDSDMDIPEVKYINDVDYLSVEYPSAYPSGATMICPDAMLEIFSVSFHWKDESCARYNIYGNIFLEDMDAYFQKAMQVPSSHSIIVSNGESLPLCGGIIRSLCGRIGCFISMCLKGAPVSKSRNIGSKDSKILIRDRKTLHYIVAANVQYDVPKVEFLFGVDRSYCACINYSVTFRAFLVEVEVKLIAIENDWEQPLCVDGKLSVHWLMFEEDNEEIDCYKIILFDTKWASLVDASGRMYVEPGKPIPLWRSKFIAPYEQTLVFGADFETSAGDKFSEQIQIFVDYSRTFSAQLESWRHRLQVDVVSLVTM